MNIYHYNPITGEFLSVGLADPNPLEPGKFLIPAHATEIEPPVTSEKQVAVWNRAAWLVEEDHRGTALYKTTTGEEIKISEIGAIPEGLTVKKKPSELYDWDEVANDWVINLYRLKQTKVASLYANLEQTFLAGVDVSTVEGNTSGVTRIKCEPLDLQMWEQGRKEAETKAYVGIVVDFSGCVWKNVESAAYIAMHEAQKRFSEMWWTHFSLLRDMVLTSEDETAIQNITWDTVPM